MGGPREAPVLPDSDRAPPPLLVGEDVNFHESVLQGRDPRRRFETIVGAYLVFLREGRNPAGGPPVYLPGRKIRESAESLFAHVDLEARAEVYRTSLDRRLWGESGP